MKKINLIIIAIVSLFILTGCESEKVNDNNDSNAPAGLKEVTGKVVKAKLDDNGNIIIMKMK